MDNQKLGEALRTLRRRRRLTQEEVAQAIGVKRPAYTAWENGKSRPSVDSVISLANLYDVDFKDIIEFQTSLFEDQLSEDDKVLAVATELAIASDPPDSDEARTLKQLIALMENTLVHTVLLTYKGKLDDVITQGRAIYAIAAAESRATARIKRKIKAITANARDNVSQQVE